MVLLRSSTFGKRTVYGVSILSYSVWVTSLATVCNSTFAQIPNSPSAMANSSVSSGKHSNFNMSYPMKQTIYNGNNTHGTHSEMPKFISSQNLDQNDSSITFPTENPELMNTIVSKALSKEVGEKHLLDKQSMFDDPLGGLVVTPDSNSISSELMFITDFVNNMSRENLSDEWELNLTSSELLSDINITSDPLISTAKPLTIDDFIIITMPEYARLGRAGNRLTYKGLFDKKSLWWVGENGTNYIMKVYTYKERIADWKIQMANATEGELVCSYYACTRYDQALFYLKTLEAYRDGRVIPSQVNAFRVMVSVFSVAAFIGVSANGLILSAVFRTRQTSTNILIGSLAASDILVLGSCLPIIVFQRFMLTRLHMEQSVCRLWVMMRYFSIVISIFTMTVMAVERYIAVCHPLKAKVYCTVKNARRAVFLLWILSILTCIPTAFVVNPDNENDKRCLLRFGSTKGTVFAFFLTFAVLVFAFPLGVMLPLYVRIFYVLKKSTQVNNRLGGLPSGTSEQKDQGHLKARRRVIIMLFTVLVMFVVCWGPTVLFDLINGVAFLRGVSRSSTPHEGLYVQALGVCNSVLNPIIYTVMSRQYQEYLKSLCRRKRPTLVKGTPTNDTKTIQSKSTSSDRTADIDEESTAATAESTE